MKIIVFTLPGPAPRNEGELIMEMLESGRIDRVHIRKPGMDIESLKLLLDTIPSTLHSSLTLHSHAELLGEYPGIGWHFSAKRPKVETSGALSCSCHSFKEVEKMGNGCNYVTLSPVFDSISKPGYLSSKFKEDDLRKSAKSCDIIALGGVTPDKLPLLREKGYAGAAMLGYAWSVDLSTLIKEIECYNS